MQHGILYLVGEMLGERPRDIVIHIAENKQRKGEEHENDTYYQTWDGEFSVHYPILYAQPFEQSHVFPHFDHQLFKSLRFVGMILPDVGNDSHGGIFLVGQIVDVEPFRLEQRFAHHLCQSLNLIIIFGNVNIGRNCFDTGARLLIESQIPPVVVFLVGVKKFLKSKGFTHRNHQVTTEVEIVGVVDIERKHLETKLEVIKFLGGKSDTAEAFLESIHKMTALVRGFRENDDGTALAQHTGGAIVYRKVTLHVTHISVTAAESGHNLEETQDSGEDILLKDITARDKHRLPAVAIHGMQNRQRIHQSVLVIGNHDGGTAALRYILLV